MKRLALAVIVVAHVPHPAAAKGDKTETSDDEETSADDSDEDTADDTGDEETPKKKPEKKKSDAEDDFKKQDLTGHDLAGSKESNLFEKDRFFVDKVDDKKSEKGTLVQGSITSTSFAYREAGDNLMGLVVPSNSQYARLFTDLRLQTDFRHISGGNWDARVDTRGRVVADPGPSTQQFTPATNSSSQSGFLGENELEIKELWVARSGKRTDLTFGRQFVADLAGVKFDGLRFDYASSSKFTLLGFGGLYPIRGSRSITTDYTPLKAEPDSTGNRDDAGKLTGAGGFGAAYRTQNMYGAFGGVALVPLSSEQPRIFGTSTGYWRVGPKMDFYHFAVLDLLGSNAVNAGLTNLSAGLNLKPDQRLRATASFNRVDTETLNVQAQAFLANPDPGTNIIQNEAFLARVAQNQLRGSLSAGLGALQRFEVTVASALRYRGEVTLRSPQADMPLTTTLKAGKSVEVYGAITDRRSFAKLRLGVDGSRIFRVGDNNYQRTDVLALRTFLARELENGHGEWEAEVAYATTRDDSAGTACGADIATCFGSAKSTTASLGGNLFYRFNRDWFGMAGLYLNRSKITSNNGMAGIADPPVTGLSGFARVAYRF